MMPLALWAAMSLKAGHPSFDPPTWPAYAAVVAVSIPIFVSLGLYRAVIRFLGHKAVFAVAFAVALSGVLLGALGFLLKIPALSWSV
jgi:FlaA1/EpsC-like NDP-sugar epimerase